MSERRILTEERARALGIDPSNWPLKIEGSEDCQRRNDRCQSPGYCYPSICRRAQESKSVQSCAYCTNGDGI